MAMSSHAKVVEDEIIPIEVAILGTAQSTNVKINVCVSCNKNFEPATMSQAKSCISCHALSHILYGRRQTVTFLPKTRANIHTEAGS